MCYGLYFYEMLSRMRTFVLHLFNIAKMEAEVTKTGINPRISYCPQGMYASKKSVLYPMKLKDILDRCASFEFKGREKGMSGCILPYISDKLGARPFKHEGVIIIDIDQFNKIPALSGQELVIYENFEKIASQYMPNLLAMNFSYSHNLHVFVYDPKVVDEKSYNSMMLVYSAYFAEAVKKAIGLDLRNYEGALDDHQHAHQKLFLNHSEYKWNNDCTQLEISGPDTIQLFKDFPMLFTSVDSRRTYRKSTHIEGNGITTVDKKFTILGWSGFDARTVIAAAAYFHFKKDLEKAGKWLTKKFSNADEIYQQMRCMAKNGTIRGKYRQEVERMLFHSEENRRILKQDEYLSDIVDFEKLTGKYYYIQSNTNTGKTEFVKGLLRDRELVFQEDDKLFETVVIIKAKKAILLQMTKALMEGKKQGIEQNTYKSQDKIKREGQIHTTMEGFVKNIEDMKIDLSEYTLIVDESHLLEEYITLRREITRDILEYLNKAGKVIFMSATPKSDFSLFPFEKLTFEKEQQQRLEVFQYPLCPKGEDSRPAALYTYMVKFVKEIEEKGEKVIVFSNKKQKHWKAYGLEKGTTLFNSNNVSDKGVVSILENNKLIRNITLATKYMGCGVEVKNEKRVHIVFFLDEGSSFDFIVQSIGRPRDAKQICLHLFYTSYKKWSNSLSMKEMETLTNAFKYLTTYTRYNDLVVNVLAAEMTSIYDVNHVKSIGKEKINRLIIGNVVNENNIHTPYSVDLFRLLPYKEVEIKTYGEIVLQTDKTVKRMREEKTLIRYLLNCPKSVWEMIERMEYEELFQSIPYYDKTNARKTIRMCKYIRNQNLDLKEVISYFGTVRRSFKYVKAMVTYCKIEAGLRGIKVFEGAEMLNEKFEDQFARMKNEFTQEFLNAYIEELMRPNFYNRLIFRMDYLPEFIDVLKSMDMWEGDKMYDSIDFSTDFVGIEMFKTKSFKENVDRKLINTINGKKGGRKWEIVTLRNLETGELKGFKSKSECSRWLRDEFGFSTREFNKFMKGQGKICDKFILMD